MPGRPKATLSLSSDSRSQLQSMTQSDSHRPAMAMRARIVLACAAGETNVEIAKRFSLSKATVGKWRQRFLESGCAGLYDNPRSGKPPAYDSEAIEALFDKARSNLPSATPHRWSVRALAKATGLPKSSVHRYLQKIEFQQCLEDGKYLLRNPLFPQKTQSILGLYLNPPDNAFVIGIEKRPLSPMHEQGKSVQGKRDSQDMAILTAALNIASLMPKQKPTARQRHYELLDFLKRTEETVPDDLEIHVIANNKLMRAHPRVKTWLAEQHRWFIHATQAPEAWLRLVERISCAKGENGRRPGKAAPAKGIMNKIRLFEANHSKNACPFSWTKSFGNFFETGSQVPRDE